MFDWNGTDGKHLRLIAERKRHADADLGMVAEAVIALRQRQEDLVQMLDKTTEQLERLVDILKSLEYGEEKQR